MRPVSSAAAGTARTRVLFIAEAVTLAHVARPVALARSLDPLQFEVHLAHHPRYRALIGALSVTEHELFSVSPERFMQALAAGRPVYDFQTLRSYVEEERKLIADLRPDIIVGDFRLSLAVSAELAGVPYVALSNAYWSPHIRQHYTVPELPLTRLLGSTVGQWVFSLGRPFAFAWHCLPMHRLRRFHGLPSLGFNLRRVYTYADYTLYADIPELFPTGHMPAHHRFIGPVGWSPAGPLPGWWQAIGQDKPIVYLTLGSSGDASLLPRLIAALGKVDATALVSTAGMPLPGHAPANVYLAPYLPGEEAVKLASLVICNGGSPGTHQALRHGVPVIGVANNLDQYLNMAAIEKAGAGRVLRAGNCDSGKLVGMIDWMLRDATSLAAARRLAGYMAKYNAADRFAATLGEIAGEAVAGGPQRRRPM